MSDWYMFTDVSEELGDSIYRVVQDLDLIVIRKKGFPQASGIP
jgi:hypothetical protein